jgi:hypothetical protein
MNRKIPFVKSELRVVETSPGWYGRPGYPILNTPVTPRENFSAAYWDKHPWWCPVPSDNAMLMSPMYDNLLGRGGVDGTKDAFGIEWEYIASAGGSIVRPGEPYMADVNEWREKIIFPDLDKWDWAGEAEKCKIDPKLSTVCVLVNGFWFERLISFMDFAPAAMALIDDEQSDALHEYLKAMTEFGTKVVDKFCEYFPGIDGFNIHDDWGAQRSPFFSEDVAREFFVPRMKELTDHIHSKGRFVTLHSCGHVEDRVQCFIDGGFDGWDPQIMNDTQKLYDEVGDKIRISVNPTLFDPATTPEEKQRELARDFADRFCVPGKPCIVGYYAGETLTLAFTEELYEYSRKKYNV